ncbi:MAG: T9SS type A sorting domain-containing protein [Saprospiraceae bacterium]
MRLLIFLCFPFFVSGQIADTLQLATNIQDVPETSGLLWYNDQLWSHNDSGGKTELYQINTTTGATERSVFIEGATNIDWEDLAHDETHLYIGDYGNNSNGSRQDLVIYKLPLEQVFNSETDTIRQEFVETISFFYPEQTDTSVKPPNKTDFDCEGMFVFNDKIHLFTKEWLREQTTHYTLPTTSTDSIAATKGASYDLKGLVTAADISPTGEEIFLLAYEDISETGSGKTGTFGVVIRDFTDTNFLEGTAIRIDYAGGYFTNGQIEGVAYRNANELWISAEEVLIFPARLYSASLLKTLVFDLQPKLITSIKIYPNPSAEQIAIEFSEQVATPFTIQLSDSTGRILKKEIIQQTDNSYPFNLPPSLSSQIYGIQIIAKNGQIIASQTLQIAK